MSVSNQDYLTLAALVYDSSLENRINLINGWVQVTPPRNDPAGFRAGVYQNGNDIVISYCGTDQRYYTDFTEANSPGYRGTYSEQFVQAMQLYEATRRANPSANITFTGHSLGGGLAAVMGVYYNKAAITFDAAPFQASATTLATIQRYIQEVTASLPAGATIDPLLTTYAASINAQFAARESNVTQINLQGEFLNLLRSESTAIYGSGQNIAIPTGNQTVGGIALHSIRLLSAMYQSARVYKNTSTGEVVISYAGTEFGNSFSGFISDFISGNIPLAIGRYGAQALEAAKLYQRVKADAALSDNITFTGHSLGGGLAALMAVWFDRPAHVYAAAPFESAATRGDLGSALQTVLSLMRAQGITPDPVFDSYVPGTDFATRETNVTAYAIKGELLEARLGIFNWIERTSTPLFNSSAITLDAGNKHSIDLHAAALLTPNFQSQAAVVPNALTVLMDGKLYGGSVTGNQQLLITKTTSPCSCEPMRANTNKSNRAITTNSIAFCAHEIWARGRFGLKNTSCESTKKFKLKRSNTQTNTAQSATEFVVNGSRA